MRAPLLGKCFLIPHLAEEKPHVPLLIGYVDFGDDNRLVAAIWREPEWRDLKKRAFDKPVVRWYHMEKPDGTPLF